MATFAALTLGLTFLSLLYLIVGTEIEGARLRREEVRIRHERANHPR